MSNFKLLRIQYFRKWRPNDILKGVNSDLLFPIEHAFCDLLSKNSQVYKPYAFKYTEDKVLHHVFSFLIDSLEQLPHRFDLGFDFQWKALESLLKEVMGNGNLTDKLALSSKNHWAPWITSNAADLFDELCSVIPIQGLKFFVKEIGKELAGGKTSMLSRIRGQQVSNGVYQNANLADIIYKLDAKYYLQHMQPDNLRKASWVIYKLLNGKTVNINGIDCQLSVFERVLLIVSGILYTFRNNRFHGNFFSPFKSSKATIQTYTLPHYAFLAVNFFLLSKLSDTHYPAVIMKDFKFNFSYNIAVYKQMYKNQLNK